MSDSPVLNTMMEDYLAVGGTEEDHAVLLGLWMMLGVEYMARLKGRQYTIRSLQNLSEFVRTASPGQPWKP